FLKNIFQRWRNCNIITNRKAQPVCLPGAVIWVLPYDYNLHIFKRCVIEGRENLLSGRETFVGGIFRFYELHQIFKVWFLKFLTQNSFPPRLNCYFHIVYFCIAEKVKLTEINGCPV